MRVANRLVGETLGEVAKHIAPGVTTKHLDTIAYTFICDHGATPAFLGYGGFPASICTSINDHVYMVSLRIERYCTRETSSP